PATDQVFAFPVKADWPTRTRARPRPDAERPAPRLWVIVERITMRSTAPTASAEAANPADPLLETALSAMAALTSPPVFETLIPFLLLLYSPTRLMAALAPTTLPIKIPSDPLSATSVSDIASVEPPAEEYVIPVPV